MNTLLERFIRYARIDTQAVEGATGYPSSVKQLELCRMLARECQEIGLADVTLSDFGIVTATLPASSGSRAPAIAWFAHVDTSPEFTAENVRPIVHPNYDGRDLVLPGDSSRVLRTSENPQLLKLIGRTIITTDGTTLLGADDKSGIAVIMTAAAHLLAHPEIVHGPIRVCFTCDEEVGHGVDHVDLDKLGVVCGYTLDSEGCGRIDSETFSADLAIVKVTGVNTHPSIGKGAMVNAVRILSDFISRMPTDRLSPETTDARDGFLHPVSNQRRCGVGLRADHSPRLRDGNACRSCPAAREDCRRAGGQAPACANRSRDPQAVPKHAGRDGQGAPGPGKGDRGRAGRRPRAGAVANPRRHGRIGAHRAGLPTPNLSSGQHNPHSPLEWTCLEEMQKAVDILIELAKTWGREKA